MDKGLKPTRLWYKSGSKHIRNWVHDRITAIKGYDNHQRNVYDGLKLNALVWGMSMLICYSFGVFSPEKYSAVIQKTGPAPDDCIKKCATDSKHDPCSGEK